MSRKRGEGEDTEFIECSALIEIHGLEIKEDQNSLTIEFVIKKFLRKYQNQHNLLFCLIRAYNSKQCCYVPPPSPHP